MQDTPEEVMRDEAANRTPYNQQTQPMAQPQAGDEGDPSLSREIPGTETGEQRWAGADMDKDMGAPGPASPNVEESRQATPVPQPPSDEGYLEEPGATASSEAYGQAETRRCTIVGRPWQQLWCARTPSSCRISSRCSSGASVCPALIAALHATLARACSSHVSPWLAASPSAPASCSTSSRSDDERACSRTPPRTPPP